MLEEMAKDASSQGNTSDSIKYYEEAIKVLK
jgi:hypothetical protein